MLYEFMLERLGIAARKGTTAVTWNHSGVPKSQTACLSLHRHCRRACPTNALMTNLVDADKIQ